MFTIVKDVADDCIENIEDDGEAVSRSTVMHWLPSSSPSPCVFVDETSLHTPGCQLGPPPHHDVPIDP